jgi:hypothetical protein
MIKKPDDMPAMIAALSKILLIGSQKSISDFMDNLAFSLCQLTGAEASCVLSSNPFRSCGVLKVFYGKDNNILDIYKPSCGEIEIYKKTILENDNKKSFYIFKTESERDSFNQILNKKLGLKNAVAFPVKLGNESFVNVTILSKSNMKLENIGVICLYFEKPIREYLCEELLSSFTSSISELISLFWISAIKAECDRLWRLIIDKSISSRDLNSILFKAIHILKAEIGYEAASIFLWDNDHNLLKLHATTGLKQADMKKNVFYRLDENDRITLNVGKNGFISTTCNILKEHNIPGKHEEYVENHRQSFLAFPILDWGAKENPYDCEPLGVLRIINKTTTYKDQKSVVCFTWDDIIILEYISELFGVISNLMQRSMRTEDHFDRVMHGFKAGLQAINMYMSHLDVRPDAYEIRMESLKYNIPDTISLIKDLKSQIDRQLEWYRASDVVQSKKQEILKCENIFIFGNVLAKIKAVIPEMAFAHNVRSIVCRYDDYDLFEHMPAVIGNIEALNTVFRNLIENAIKYSIQSKDPLIILRYRAAGDYIEILVDDNGIGVPLRMEQWIFRDGFRCENAIRVKPAGGSGIGLPQSYDLCNKMNGDLYFERVDGWTRFVVKLRKA